MADFKLKQTGTQTQNDLDWVDSLKDNLTQDEDTTKVSGSFEVGGDLVIDGIDKLTNTEGSQLVEANPSDESSVVLQKLKVGDTIYVIEGQDIEANPSGEATDDLSKLKLGDTIYGITNVEANPSDESTAELSKLKVGNNTYNVLSVKSWDASTGALYLE